MLSALPSIADMRELGIWSEFSGARASLKPARGPVTNLSVGHLAAFRSCCGRAYTAVVFVLRYKRDGEFRVVILDGISVAHARMAAAFLEPGWFIEGRKIDEASAARLPRWAVG